MPYIEDMHGISHGLTPLIEVGGHPAPTTAPVEMSLFLFKMPFSPKNLPKKPRENIYFLVGNHCPCILSIFTYLYGHYGKNGNIQN